MSAANWISSVLAAVLMALAIPAATAADAFQNLATTARITASSVYSPDYDPRHVADGQLPAALSHDDRGRAWCVDGQTHRAGAELNLSWARPVSVATLVYYGRTAWFLEECWRGYEIYLNGASIPAAVGQFAMRHGPQRVRLSDVAGTVTNLQIRFTSSYGGLNPGAAELQVFSNVPSDRDAARLLGGDGPPVDGVSVSALRGLIGELRRAHGEGYAKAASHLAQLDEIGRQQSQGADRATALVELQRAVLLFDAEHLLAVQRHEIDSSHVYTYHNEGFRAGGGVYVIPTSAPDQARQLVASPRGQILDCDLSYDGRTVLFSWREGENEGYHLWTVGIDGQGLRPLTQGEWHDYNGCWLPDGGIAFVSTRHPQFAYCWNSPVGVVHRMNADGSGVQRLSANYLNDFTPYPLEDGRLVYSRWEYVDKPAIPIQSLWTIHPDGTSLAGYYGNRTLSPGTFMEARPIPGTALILCTMTGHNGPARGAIGVVDRRRGVNAQEAIWNVTPDVPVPGVRDGNGNFDGTKLYSTPVPLDRNRFLVSARGPALVRTLSGTCQSTALSAPPDGLCWFCTQPIRPRILQVRPKAWGSSRSRLAEVILSNHPNSQGKPRFRMDEASRRRILAWIDLNVPYYGTSETSHPDNAGSRRIYPERLDAVLAEVGQRRCAACHTGGKAPRRFWTRIAHPQWNSFLMAPLPESAGGSGACGEAVFRDASDPDYVRILQTFEPALADLRQHPRTDMPGAQVSLTVNRSCK